MNSRTKKALLNAARDGDRLVLEAKPKTFQVEAATIVHHQKNKTLWAGLGNRSGLHGYASELLRDKFTKSGARLGRKLDKLPVGSTILVLFFRNVTRDRGRWVEIARYTID